MNKIAYCSCHQPCFALCINNKCTSKAIMCNQGLSNKTLCGKDHQNCKKLQWNQFEKLINNNPRKNTNEFHQIENKIDHLFIDLISKIKEEHINFKLWLTMYGLSLDAMNLIADINQQKIDKITGKSIHPVVIELYNQDSQTFIPPKIDQNQINRIRQTIELQFINLAEVYLKKLKTQEAYGEDQIKTIRKSSQTRATGNDSSFFRNSLNVSKVLQTAQQLTKFFEKPVKTMKLLYRASQHKFSTKKFHDLCDNIPNTLILIKNQHNKVFGGFTPLQWSKDKKGFESDQNYKSFMFSLDMKEKFKLNLPQFAIAQSYDSGPIFGCNDLLITDQANVMTSRSQFPICYKNEKTNKRSSQISVNFCGSKIGKFLIKQWEVFEVDFEISSTKKIEEEFMKLF